MKSCFSRKGENPFRDCIESCKCFHAELNCSAYLFRREFHRFHELWSSSAGQIIDSFAEKMEPDTCSVLCMIMGRSSKIQLRPFHRYYLLFVRNQKLRYQQNRTKFFSYLYTTFTIVSHSITIAFDSCFKKLALLSRVQISPPHSLRVLFSSHSPSFSLLFWSRWPPIPEVLTQSEKEVNYRNSLGNWSLIFLRECYRTFSFCMDQETAQRYITSPWKHSPNWRPSWQV